MQDALRTLAWGLVAAVAILILLSVWVLDLGIALLAPALFWFISIPLIAVIALTSRIAPSPTVKRILSSCAAGASMLLVCSGLIVLALALRKT